jgi:cytochrome c oxidase subunit 3
MSVQVSPIDEVKTTPWSGGKSPFNVEYGKMMMWFFLLSDAFTFSSLLIAYGSLTF